MTRPEWGGRRTDRAVIGAVLLAGAAAASINPRWTRAAGLMALGFCAGYGLVVAYRLRALTGRVS